jgi:hypothetical protein
VTAFGHRGVCDIDAQFEQLTVDLGSAPRFESDRAPLCRSVAGRRADGISIVNTRRSPFDANAQQSRA